MSSIEEAIAQLRLHGGDDGPWVIEEIGDGRLVITEFRRWMSTRTAGWVPHNGEGLPSELSSDTHVGVRWRCWDEYMGRAAGFNWHWSNRIDGGNPWDIIAYMRLPEPKIDA